MQGGGGDQATKQWVPATSLRKTLQWSSLRAVSFLRHGSGTSIFSALLNDVSVVIKAPRYGISEEETRTVTAELLHEVQVLEVLEHPHIITYFGSGTMPLKNGGSAFFLVVKRLGGGILSSRIQTSGPRAAMSGGQAAQGISWAAQKMTYVDILRYAEHLASALHYMHSGAAAKGRIILHRDLKPDNLGFTEDGVFTLFDFGLTTSIPLVVPQKEGVQPNVGSDKQQGQLEDVKGPTKDAPPPPPPEDASQPPPLKAAEQDPALTSAAAGEGNSGGGGGGGGLGHHADRTEASLPRYRLTGNTGSVRYMAPEVALDQPYNQSVDVYSFGMILWEMLHKTKPFTGMNKEMHLEQVCLQGKRPHFERHAVPAFVALLKEMWHQDMDRRPSFAGIVVRLREMREVAVAMRGEPRGRRSPGLVCSWPWRRGSSAGNDAAHDPPPGAAGGSSSRNEVARPSARRWIFKKQSSAGSAASSSWF